MSDISPSDNELISSYLDGEATPEEVAQVDGAPALRARAEELRAASELVATPVVPLRVGDTDRLIATALAESVTTETVTDLAVARQRRTRFQQRFVAVAAGVLLIALAVPTLIAINNSTDSDSSTAATVFDADDGGDDASSDADDDGADAGEEASLSPLDTAAAAAESAGDDAADDGADADRAAPDGNQDDLDAGGFARSATARTSAGRSLLDQLADDGADPFLDGEELVDSASDAWKVYLTSGGDDSPAATIEIPDYESETVPTTEVPCADELRLFFDLPEHTFDLGTVEIGGELTSIGIVVDLAGATARLAIASPPACEPVQLAILD